MSKSYDNTIPLFAPEAQLRKLVNRITSSSKDPKDPFPPDNCNIFNIYKHFASDEQILSMRKRYAEGISWGHAKDELFSVINDSLKSARKMYDDLMKDRPAIDTILANGAEKVGAIAERTLADVKDLSGIRKRGK